jgi:hypothetical protein
MNAKMLMKVSTQGLGGGDSRARTGDPPPSHRTDLRLTPGTGISYAETGDRKDDLSHTETELETRRVREKPPL